MKKLCSIGILVSLHIMLPVSAKVQCINTVDRFNRVINDKPLCVAYFYDYVKQCRDKCSKESQQEQYEKFKAVSRLPRYKAADVSFIALNIGSSKLRDLQEDLDLITTPTFLVFKDGATYENNCAQTQLTGCATKADIMQFIDSNLGDEVDTIIKNKEDARRAQLEEDLFWYNYYGMPWYGYCGWGCGPGWYGNGFGYGGYGCGRTSGYVNFGVGFCN